MLGWHRLGDPCLIHDHKDRPGTVYVLQGTITDHPNRVTADYTPGVSWPEDSTPPTLE